MAAWPGVTRAGATAADPIPALTHPPRASLEYPSHRSAAPSHRNGGDSSPGQGLPWGFLCFRRAPGQDTAPGIWDGFGEPCRALWPARDGLLWSKVHCDSSKLWSPCNIKWLEIPVPQQRLFDRAARSQRGQLNCLVWHLVREGHLTVAPVGKDGCWGCLLGNEWVVGHHLPAPCLKLGVR